MLTVEQVTGLTVEHIEALNLPQRIQLQKEMEDKNQHTNVLIVDAIIQKNTKVLESLLIVADFHAQEGYLNHTLYEFRNWLSTLLVK